MAASSVVVVDDDRAVAAHIAAGVAGHPALRLAAAVHTLADARAAIDAGVALYIVDLGLPDGSGIDLIRDIRTRIGASPRILVLTVLGDQQTVIEAVMAGADGYVLKDMDGMDIARQAADAVSGGAPLSPTVAAYVLRHLRAQATPAAEDADTGLSPRELELLQLLARGYSNKQAAVALALSPHTVGDYVKSIYRKLRVSSRGEAMSQAFRQGLLRS